MYWTAAYNTNLIGNNQPFYEDTQEAKSNTSRRLDGSSNQNEPNIVKVGPMKCNNVDEDVKHEAPDEFPSGVKRFNWGQWYYRF